MHPIVCTQTALRRSVCFLLRQETEVVDKATRMRREQWRQERRGIDHHPCRFDPGGMGLYVDSRAVNSRDRHVVSGAYRRLDSDFRVAKALA